MRRRFWLSDKLFENLQSYPHTISDKNCIPGILVSSNVRFMRIFAGFRKLSLERERQMRVGSSKTAIFCSFAFYIFRSFTFKATIL